MKSLRKKTTSTQACQNAVSTIEGLDFPSEDVSWAPLGGSALFVETTGHRFSWTDGMNIKTVCETMITASRNHVVIKLVRDGEKLDITNNTEAR